MDRSRLGLTLTAATTIALFGTAPYWADAGWWGVNHLKWLPGGFQIAFWIVSAIALALITLRPSETYLHSVLDRIDSLLFSRRIGAVTLAMGAVILLWLLRASTHFLGDGYEWLGNFSRPDVYIHKWAEPLSPVIVRLLQSLQGGYSEATALWTFQVLSVISGCIVVYNAVRLTAAISDTPSKRLMILSSMLFSCGGLLYFGYVEFYPMLWAAAFVFFNSAINSLIFGKGWLTAVAAYAACLAIHLEAITLAPGVVYLIGAQLENPRLRRLLWTISIALSAAGLVGLAILYSTRIDIEVLLLPLLNGRSPAEDYTILSSQHWLDLFQLAMIVAPGLAIILSQINWRRHSNDDRIDLFWILCSLGSGLFVVIFGAAITMARDWDVMAWGLLPATMWVLWRLGRSERTIVPSTALAYSLIVAVISLLYLNTSLDLHSSKERFESLLTDRHHSSWITLSSYYEDQGDKAKARQIMRRSYDYFPEYRLLERTYADLGRGNLKAALQNAEQLVEQNPYQSDFLQLAGNVYGRMGRFEEAHQFYRDAIILRPYFADLRRELGLLYLQGGRLGQALRSMENALELDPASIPILEAIGLFHLRARSFDRLTDVIDTLFATEQGSSGGHMLAMVMALDQGDTTMALLHYGKFYDTGRDRSDYRTVVEKYGFLEH